MSFMMLRGCLAVAAAAVVAFAPAPSAEARPGVSPFAGTYAWNSGTHSVDSWAVTISDGGQITGSLVSSPNYTKGSLKGQVGADGSYSFTMSVTGPTFDDPERGHDRGPNHFTSRTSFAGIMAPNSDGNLVGTPATGTSQSFVWFRQ